MNAAKAAALAAATTLAASVTATWAAPPDSVVMQLPDVVVSATRTPRAARDLPGVVRVVSKADILERMPRTPTDALRGVAGVMLQKTSPGQGSPFVRGFTGFRVVHLIDGVRLNNSVFRDGPNQYWNLFDAFDVRSLEVVLGPAAVAYGSDAVGGALHAVGPRPWLGGASSWSSSVYYRAASAEQSQLGRVEVGYSDSARGGVRAAWTMRDLGSLRAGHDVGLQPHTGYRDGGGDVRGEVPMGRGYRMMVAHQDYRQNGVPRTHSTVYARSFAGTTVGTDFRRDTDLKRRLTYVQLRPNPGTGRLRVHAGASYQSLEEDENRVRSDLSRRTQGFDVGTVGGFAQTEATSPFGQWTLGMEAYHDDVDSHADFNPIQGPVGDDATYDTGAAFAIHEIRFADALTLLSGVRYTSIATNAERVRDPVTGSQISVDGRWRAVTGSARCGWFPNRGTWGAFIGVSQAFRAPNLSDLTRFDIARTSEIEVPSPDLSPEHFVSAELGFRIGRPTLDLELTGFHTWIDDLIVRRPTGRILEGSTEVKRVNAGDGFVHGVETSGQWRALPQWWLRGHLAWQFGEADQYPGSAPLAAREPLSRVLPLTGACSISWTAPGLPLGVEVEIAGAARQDRLSTEDRRDTSRIPPGGTPGYVVGNLRAHARAFGHTRWTLAVENVANEDYRVHGSGSNEPGRNVVLGAEVRY